MQYLAQIHQDPIAHTTTLQLLAYQESAYTWKLLTEGATIALANPPVGQGSLVLVELADQEVLDIQNATDWVLQLIQDYLDLGVTPEFLKAEAVQAEEWRQNLTLQSQDLARRNLELEARLKQVQALEEKLIKEQKILDERKLEFEKRLEMFQAQMQAQDSGECTSN